MKIDPCFCSLVTSRTGKYLSREFIPLANCDGEKKTCLMRRASSPALCRSAFACSQAACSRHLPEPPAESAVEKLGCTQDRLGKKGNVPEPERLGVCHRDCEKPGGNNHLQDA